MNIDDVWTGRLSARHVVILTNQLVLNPNSRVYALKGGASDLQGWTTEATIAARTHNLIAGILAGFSKGVSASDLLIEHPAVRVANEVKQPKTLAEFSISGFNSFMYDE